MDLGQTLPNSCCHLVVNSEPAGQHEGKEERGRGRGGGTGGRRMMQSSGHKHAQNEFFTEQENEQVGIHFLRIGMKPS